MDSESNIHAMLDDTMADAATVDDLFQTILGRAINNDEFKKQNDGTHSLRHWVSRLINSEEFKTRFLNHVGAQLTHKDFIADADYRTPKLGPNRIPKGVLITGSCMTEAWADALRPVYPTMEVHHVLFNNASELEDLSEARLKDFDFQIGQISLRSIINEGEYFGSSPSNTNPGPENAMFEVYVQRLKANISALTKYNKAAGMPVFLLNFATPQFNPLGALMPRYEMSNFAYLVERLNVAFAEIVAEESGVYLIDFDAIAATLGKRYVIDDMSSHFNHGSFIGGTFWPEDIQLTPYGSITNLYRPKVGEAIFATFNECVAAYEIISTNKKIKIVVFDLDGTLWRGVPADLEEIDPGRISEGWPLSIVEAASFLKKRGILLALASKNDPNSTRKLWDRVYGKRFPLTNFVSVKISWESKVASINEILNEVNLLPENCLFVDDNPIEREQVSLAFPGISVINGPISTWKRTLLCSPELQSAFLTKEAATRTESTQKMVERESRKLEFSAEAYLQSLNVKIEIDRVEGLGDKRFRRVHELLNKTNQFNTTGKRWTNAELQDLFASGGQMYVATVTDRLTEYGLTAIAIRCGQVCEQMVMSCRVFGLKVEHNLLAYVLNRMEAPAEATIAFRRTDKNGPTAQFLTSIGVALTTNTAQIGTFASPQGLALGELAVANLQAQIAETAAPAAMAPVKS